MGTAAPLINTSIAKLRSLPWIALSMTPNRALEAALALSRAPNMVRLFRRQPLPPGITLLLQIVAGDAEALSDAHRQTRLDRTELIELVELYIMQVMLFRGASSWRVLGIDDGADRDQARRHMSYLMGWLHPDKSGRAWRGPFARRVLQAWRRIDREAEVQRPQQSFRKDKKNEKALFLLPWITLPPEQAPWYHFVNWRRRLRFWRSI